MNPEEYHLMRQIEDDYWWYRGMRQITFALLGRYLTNIGNLRILDAGCGTGGMMQHLSRLGAVYGVDFSNEAIQLASERKTGTILRASITDIPFPGATFDLITCFDVIYHLSVSDDLIALKEMSRVLKPGGKLLVRVPAYDFLRGKHDVAVHTKHRYTVGELRSKLERAGLRPLKATYAATFFFPLAGAKRLWETVSSPPADSQSDLKPLPGLVSRILLSTMAFESWLVQRTSLPFGLSAICLATKEG